MGKVGGSSWLNVVKKAFSSPSKEHQQDEDEKRGKRRWIFRKPLFRETTIQHNNEETNNIINTNAISETVNHHHAMARNSACYRNTNESMEVEKRCTIAAALATAAAAEAAQAAMEVIRLTTNTRIPISAMRIREHLHFAAIMIQTAFRGYLARKALKALKGLVKLQALVRGHNVRGRTKMTLQCMQSMVRVQTQLCDQRSRRLSSSSATFKETGNSISRDESNSDIYSEMEEEIPTKEDCLNCKRRLGFSSSREQLDSRFETGRTSFDQTNLTMIKTIRMDTSQSHNFSPSPSKQSNRRNSLSSPSKSYHNIVDQHPKTNNYPKPLTPTRSVVHPNYMSDTASAKAKIRTHSAPRTTRPVTPEREHNWRSAKRRMSGPAQDHHVYNDYSDDIDDSEVFVADYNQSLPRSSHVRVWLR
ncbi:protein IQ-DOMAIN 17-like isoform X2 [Impatiens glandulifera]|uniref:protein IQ-DOMAIN 17-like isoform X2 n=1 Tax=Impatiens glandulifera TaxID=253017 RepID=UPI001FB1713B|nr:protein IQ-DOMAIN 17-like isoform X2 [Impatiens glandulifera]